MTITGMAKELNVSAMTVYRRMKRAGVNVTELRDDATGELTSEGVAVIGSLFDATGQQAAQQADAPRTQPAAQPDTQPAEVEAAVLRVKLEASEATVQRLEDEVQRLRGECDRLVSMLEVEQRQRQQLLTDGQQRRGGLFGWLRRPRDGSGTD